MATCSSILVWKIPWTEEPGGLQFIGLQRVRFSWAAEQTCMWIQEADFLDANPGLCICYVTLGKLIRPSVHQLLHLWDGIIINYCVRLLCKSVEQIHVECVQQWLAIFSNVSCLLLLIVTIVIIMIISSPLNFLVAGSHLSILLLHHMTLHIDTCWFTLYIDNVYL